MFFVSILFKYFFSIELGNPAHKSVTQNLNLSPLNPLALHLFLKISLSGQICLLWWSIFPCCGWLKNVDLTNFCEHTPVTWWTFDLTYALKNHPNVIKSTSSPFPFENVILFPFLKIKPFESSVLPFAIDLKSPLINNLSNVNPTV